MVDFDTALRIESRYLAKIVVGAGQEHDQHVLLQHERDQGGQVAAQGLPRWQAAKVGMLGAGMMGAGIAYAKPRAASHACSRT